MVRKDLKEKMIYYTIFSIIGAILMGISVPIVYNLKLDALGWAFFGVGVAVLFAGYSKIRKIK